MKLDAGSESGVFIKALFMRKQVLNLGIKTASDKMEFVVQAVRGE